MYKRLPQFAEAPKENRAPKEKLSNRTIKNYVRWEGRNIGGKQLEKGHQTHVSAEAPQISCAPLVENDKSYLVE